MRGSSSSFYGPKKKTPAWSSRLRKCHLWMKMLGSRGNVLLVAMEGPHATGMGKKSTYFLDLDTRPRGSGLWNHTGYMAETCCFRGSSNPHPGILFWYSFRHMFWHFYLAYILKLFLAFTLTPFLFLTFSIFLKLKYFSKLVKISFRKGSSQWNYKTIEK